MEIKSLNIGSTASIIGKRMLSTMLGDTESVYRRTPIEKQEKQCGKVSLATAILSSFALKVPLNKLKVENLQFPNEQW